MENEEQVKREAIEAEATALGWTTKDQWRGDESKFTDAPEYVKGQKDRTAHLKKKREEAENRANKADGRIADLETRLESLAKSTEAVGKIAYDKALKEIEDRQREAVENSDGDGFTKAEADRKQLEANKPEPIPAAQPRQGEEIPEFREWKAENTWYTDNPTLHNAAEAIAAVMKGSGFAGTPIQFFAEVKRQVQAGYPQEFTNPNRENANSVETGSGGGRNKSTKKGYNDLPPEAKAACDRFVGNGMVKDVEQYLSTYDFGE